MIDWLELTDEQKKQLRYAFVALITFILAAAALLGEDIRDEVCGNITVYVCTDGTLVGNPDNCLKVTTTTTSTTSTSVPVTSIPTTSLPVQTTIMQSYCTGRSSGSYCDGIDWVECSGGVEIDRKSCDMIWAPKVVRRNDKMATEWKQVPGLCTLNSEGADCCSVEICG